jgi:hypothetical protein
MLNHVDTSLGGHLKFVGRRKPDHQNQPILLSAMGKASASGEMGYPSK